MNIIKSLIHRPKKVINESYKKNEMTDKEILEQGLIIAKRMLSKNITI